MDLIEEFEEEINKVGGTSFLYWNCLTWETMFSVADNATEHSPPLPVVTRSSTNSVPKPEGMRVLLK